MEAVGKTFKPLWSAQKDFKTREAGDHVLLFVFELEADAERVLATESCSFDKHLVLFQRYDFSHLDKKPKVYDYEILGSDARVTS